MNLFLKGDRFLERISKTKYLHTVTFLVAFLEATISPLLPEAFLLLVLAYRKDVSWILLSITSAIGSSFGALTMYLLGKELYAGYGNKILTLLHGEAMASRASELFHNNAFMAQFLAALTPLPDRVFSFLAGVFLVSPFIVLLATFLGRLIRILPIAYLSYEYGDEARVYIKKHTKLTAYVLAVLLALYCVYKYFI